MVASNAQAASAAASCAQGAHHSEPQPYASQTAARSTAMMRPSPNLQQQQQHSSSSGLPARLCCSLRRLCSTARVTLTRACSSPSRSLR